MPCISYPQKRIALHTQLILRNRSLSVYGVLNYDLIRGYNPVYCATGVVALTCFLFRAYQYCLQDKDTMLKMEIKVQLVIVDTTAAPVLYIVSQ